MDNKAKNEADIKAELKLKFSTYLKSLSSRNMVDQKFCNLNISWEIIESFNKFWFNSINVGLEREISLLSLEKGKKAKISDLVY